jgi:hypothetical protein
MSLDTNIDYKVEYSTDIEHSSLYSWCLREFDEDGEQKGRDWIPWGYSLNFRADKLFYHCQVKSDGFLGFAFGDDDNDEPQKIELEETIIAKLQPTEHLASAPRYYMMGCSRQVEDISVTIYKFDKDEHCLCYVMPEYEGGPEFHEKDIPDTIAFSIFLKPEEFDAISLLIKNDNIGDVVFDFSTVDGFYSDWSPDIITDTIKVLGSPTDHNLELTEDLKESVSRAGNIGGFRISTGTKHYAIEDRDDIFLTDEYEDENNYESSNNVASVSTKNPNEGLEKLVSKLRWPLWLIFAFLVIVAMKL